MPSITFELETVTPLFLAGANQTTAELRPPAFRGALRYWFRALAGACYWDNLAKLKEIESDILGDTNASSNIIVRLSNVPETLNLSNIPLNQEENPGLSYLLFSMKGSGGKKPKPQRKAIGAHRPVKFCITLSIRPNPRNKEKQEKSLLIAANCFWLAVNLGGFGSRERRGAGSLCVTGVNFNGLDETRLPKFQIGNYKPETLSKYLRGELIKLKKIFSNLLELDLANASEPNPTPQIEIISKYNSRVFLLTESYSSWEEALDVIGEKYKNYRQTLAIEERAIFGFPIMNLDMDLRRPSPLRFKVIKSGNKYYCLLIQIKATFPENSIINPENPSYKNMNNFIGSFNSDEIQQVG